MAKAGHLTPEDWGRILWLLGTMQHNAAWRGTIARARRAAGKGEGE